MTSPASASATVEPFGNGRRCLYENDLQLHSSFASVPALGPSWAGGRCPLRQGASTASSDEDDLTMMMLARGRGVAALALGVLFGAGFLASAAAADSTIEITIKGHKFDPAEIHVPAGKAVVLSVTNQDDTPEEFESHELKFEKIIPGGGGTGTVKLRPLDPGTYPFFGEFHEDTAKGVVIAE
jgi:plastocyanin